VGAAARIEGGRENEKGAQSEHEEKNKKTCRSSKSRGLPNSCVRFVENSRQMTALGGGLGVAQNSQTKETASRYFPRKGEKRS